MQKFLRQYRATPHLTTGVVPYKLLFNMDLNTTLPTVRNELLTKNDPYLKELVHINDDLKKQKMKSREDKRNKAANASGKRIGDYVVLENETRGKITPIYDPKPYKVVSRKGSMITVKRAEKNVTRVSSRFKPVAFDVLNDPASEEDEEDDIDSILNQTPENHNSQEKRPATESIDTKSSKNKVPSTTSKKSPK